MKLVWAVVENEDASRAVRALTEAGYRTTRINTVGGLLKRGNVSLMTGVEAEQVDTVIGILRQHCQARQPSADAPAPRARAVVFVLDSPGFLQV
ncbi:MAG TPA: cyclic-di-AMP receptor [Chloroflexota bacterium]|nr:cyclic-di-AMP receptor [Chloroflexota bacterium]